MDLFLKTAIFGDDDLDLTDCPDIDGNEDFSDPVAKLYEASDLKQLGVPEFSDDWDAPVGMIAKREDAKSKSLAKAVCYEVREIDGERWSVGLTVDGEIGTMRWLLPERIAEKHFSD